MNRYNILFFILTFALVFIHELNAVMTPKYNLYLNEQNHNFNATEENIGYLADKNTPVWFIESNGKDPETPKLYKIENALLNNNLIEKNLISTVNRNLSRTNLKNLSTLYVQVLVIVDFGLYKKLGESVSNALEYVISFWYGVDLRYKLIASPKVYINIAGIILAKDPTALYYIDQSKNDKGHVIANKVLFDGGKFFLYEQRLKNYDISVTMTTEDICSMASKDMCNNDIVGLSLLDKACHSYLNTAVIEDNGGFNGIIAATHEIAHLMNVPHDGTGAAFACSRDDGYIMTPSASVTRNNFKWSRCSKNIIKKFSLTKSADCLRNKPTIDSIVRKVLPGKLIDANEQCNRAGYSYSCYNDKKICNALSCFRVNYQFCDADGPAAEGSSCGENLYCRDGECVPESS